MQIKPNRMSYYGCACVCVPSVAGCCCLPVTAVNLLPAHAYRLCLLTLLLLLQTRLRMATCHVTVITAYVFTRC